MKKLLIALLTLAMAFTMVFATAASAEDGYKDSITWVIGNDQDILDPQNNVSNSKVIPQYYNGLLGYDNDGNVVCKMAESYEASEDKMTWTFHLRQDVYFHSGRHCTAHDFEATFDRLFVAHDMSVIRYISDRVGVMYLGHLVEEGDTDEVFDHPQHPYTRTLMSAVPSIDPRDNRQRILLEGDLPSPIDPPSGCIFHTRCPWATEACKTASCGLREVRKGHYAACSRGEQE